MSARRQLAISFAPAALALAVLAFAGPLPTPPSAPAGGWIPFSLLICLALASLHRPLGGSTLSLGALTLPAALVLSGPVGAAWLGAAGYALGGVGRRALRRLSPSAAEERRGFGRLAEGAGRAALAALGGGWAWQAASAEATAPAWSAWAAGGAGYAATFGVLILAARGLRRPRQRLRPVHLTAPLALDLGGWGVGCLVVVAALGPPGGPAASGQGWGMVTALLWVVALLATESARLASIQGAFERRAVDLERVSQASRRMAASGFGLAGLAVQLRAECSRVLELHYFQLEIDIGDPDEDEEDRPRSWWIGPEGAVHGGAPSPEASPPALPGIHRRRPWRVLERVLEIDGRRLARIRLWCDPRRIEPAEVEILDRLVPQLGAWVHRALLDREAREDPLTGVPVRRLLERGLADAFASCRETGGTLAVVMCDLDHFKRINDTFGHAAGDKALKAVARTLEAHRREGDLCARYGGEEFALLMNRTGGEEALAVAERLRDAVEGLEVGERGQEAEVTMSSGVASFPELWAAAPGELLALADEALYEAKRQGRNRTLLNLGQGRFRTASGEVVEREGGGEDGIEAPRIFA